MSGKEHVIGRHRKHDLGDIVEDIHTRRLAVVVEYDDTPDARRYRVVPLDARKRRRGDAYWTESWVLQSTGEHSGTASIKTYRANAKLPDRGCECQCCVHEAIDLSLFGFIGQWKP